MHDTHLIVVVRRPVHWPVFVQQCESKARRFQGSRIGWNIRSVDLFEGHAAQDPIRQFVNWRQDAIDAGELQPDAMSLATASRGGRPSARFVIVRQVDERGFVFHTNYTSRKGVELAENGWAGLAVYWPRCERQVRVEGRVERLSAVESDEYFQSRPREAQLEAWVSQQSQVIDGREWLERQWEASGAKFQQDVPRPDWWGGYRLRPTVLEFWQQGQHRLHDRLRYQSRDDGSWQVDRLAP